MYVSSSSPTRLSLSFLCGGLVAERTSCCHGDATHTPSQHYAESEAKGGINDHPIGSHQAKSNHSTDKRHRRRSKGCRHGQNAETRSARAPAAAKALLASCSRSAALGSRGRRGRRPSTTDDHPPRLIFSKFSFCSGLLLLIAAQGTTIAKQY